MDNKFSHFVPIAADPSKKASSNESRTNPLQEFLTENHALDGDSIPDAVATMLSPTVVVRDISGELSKLHCNVESNHSNSQLDDHVQNGPCESIMESTDDPASNHQRQGHLLRAVSTPKPSTSLQSGAFFEQSHEVSEIPVLSPPSPKRQRLCSQERESELDSFDDILLNN